MLRSLARNGLPERSLLAVQRHGLRRPSRIDLEKPSLCVNHRIYRNYSRPLSFSRQLSSAVPDLKTSPKSQHVPPPTAPGPRKPKPELKPAPIKPKPSAPSGAPVTASLRPNVQQPEPAASTPSTSSAKSITETTKEDLEDAFRNGVLIPPPLGAPWYKRLFHQAKELFKFYWRGLKMVNTHRKHVNEINRRIKEGGSPLTRWEQRFIRTHRSDTLKLVPFLLIVLIMEEIIPLIAIYAPGMLPSTCVLPSQRERIEAQKRDKQKAALEIYQKAFSDLGKSAINGGISLKSLPGDVARSSAVCQLLRLSSLGPNKLRISRIRRHLEWIAKDDALLIQEGMGQQLSHPELDEALLERGIVMHNLNKSDQFARLRWWLNSVGTDTGVDPVSKRLRLVCSGARGSA
jgi:LETM1 and EF-hand domain-containing protein 1